MEIDQVSEVLISETPSVTLVIKKDVVFTLGKKLLVFGICFLNRGVNFTTLRDCWD